MALLWPGTSTTIARLRRVALAILLATCAVLLLPQPSRAAEPIEGAWIYQGGRVLVEATGEGTYRGIVSRSTRFLDCDHPTGESMWVIGGSGASYSGTHAWFQAPGCTPAPGGQATWNLRESGDKLLLDFCTSPPGTTLDASTGRCSTLERAKPPAVVPVKVCLLDACLEGAGDTKLIGCVRRGKFIHRFRVTVRHRKGRQMLVRRVYFRLDARKNGSDKYTPFLARVNAERLDAGSHVLTADVRMRSKRRIKGKYRRSRVQLKYRFEACD